LLNTIFKETNLILPLLLRFSVYLFYVAVAVSIPFLVFVGIWYFLMKKLTGLPLRLLVKRKKERKVTAILWICPKLTRLPHLGYFFLQENNNAYESISRKSVVYLW